MFEYRQVLTRMRLGDTDRAIARAGLMGRRKAAQLRRTAEAAGWLDVATPLPADAELAVHVGPVRTQPAVVSLAEPHRERITRWWRQGIQGATIVTSNLDFSEWGDAFPNRLLGAATLDRLRHGAYRLTLEGESYRSPRPMPAPRKSTVATGGKSKK